LSSAFGIFLLVVLFFTSLSAILLELALTRIFSIVLWYDYAFMAISIAFFGLGVGSLVSHLQGQSARWKDRYGTREGISGRIVYFAVGYAVSVPLFIFALSRIPPSTADIYLFYIVSSVPFFFAGMVMALVFHAMPRKINKLYFADLVGAAAATLLLDPLMQVAGAEQVIMITAPLVAGSAILAAAFARRFAPAELVSISPRLQALGIAVLAFTILAPALEKASGAGFLDVNPGPNKGLYYQLVNPSRFQHLSEQWNSFSRIDVTRKTPLLSNATSGIESQRELASIIIDADAGTPIFAWNGSRSDLSWLRSYADYLPYRLVAANSSLVIGGGGGEDIQMALAGGSRNVTVVELNPLIVSAVNRFGSQGPGDVYHRNDVHLYIDDGRHFVGASTEAYDVITIKLVDSWAAQLAGGYALSENYLYTTEAFQKYLGHLTQHGMLAMVRWNFELPRLMPLVVDAVMKSTGESREEAAKNIVVIEDRPGLYFGRSSDSQTYYPMLVMVKPTPFTPAQLDTAAGAAAQGRADVAMLGGRYVSQHYAPLFDSRTYQGYLAALENPNIPSDDSPFYFAKQPVPVQMITLLATVIALAAALFAVLAMWTRRRNAASRLPFAKTVPLLFFAGLIGLGFMALEVTFIQKFLLLLGTPILALTVILFSILLFGGIGAYLSGRLFGGRPFKAALVTLPLLAGVVLFDVVFLQQIIDSAVAGDMTYRIALTVGLLMPAGLLMGFQFPSLVGMAAAAKSRYGDITTLLWGVNVVASIIGTVLAATLAMVIGFSGTLLFGLAMYAAAAASALAAHHSWNRLRVTVPGSRQSESA
jgi:hypothetical protein